VTHSRIAVNGGNRLVEVTVRYRHGHQAAAVAEGPRIEDGADLAQQVLPFQFPQTFPNVAFADSQSLGQGQVGAGDDRKGSLNPIQQYPRCSVQKVRSWGKRYG